jgi:hypothetical protein
MIITAKEFYQMIADNPAVFEHWKTPIEITEYIECEDSNITHLCPSLTFTGKNNVGEAANFRNCKSLKNACGTFLGYVSFVRSSIETCKTLTVKKRNKAHWSASFAFCPNLQIATGNYFGYVNFEESGIHTIQALTIQNSDQDRYYADFTNCPNLKTLHGWDLSKKIFIEPAKLAFEKERRTLQKFLKESQPKALPFL